jgi:hypothetical protein
LPRIEDRPGFEYSTVYSGVPAIGKKPAYVLLVAELLNGRVQKLVLKPQK